MAQRRHDEEEWAHESRAAEAYAASSHNKPVWKTVTAAIALFTIGSFMLYFGVQVLGKERERGLAMICVGAIAFIPGSYAVCNLYGAWRGWAGYSYDHIPSYDE